MPNKDNQEALEFANDVGSIIAELSYVDRGELKVARDVLTGFNKAVSTRKKRGKEKGLSLDDKGIPFFYIHERAREGGGELVDEIATLLSLIDREDRLTDLGDFSKDEKYFYWIGKLDDRFKPVDKRMLLLDAVITENTRIGRELVAVEIGTERFLYSEEDQKRDEERYQFLGELFEKLRARVSPQQDKERVS